MQPSPATSLTVDTVGFVDYLDAGGAWLAHGVQPPAGTAFVRRWSIAASSDSQDTLVFQVVVLAIGAPGAGDVSSGREKVCLLTARTRRAR